MKLSLPVMALALTSALAAQTVETFPNTLPTAYAGNSWPFNNTATTFQCQFLYDGSMINNSGPVLIQRIRFRRSSATATTTGLLTNVTCSLSTSPQSWNTISSTFASNVGNDATVIFQGDLAVNATQWYVDITLPTPFLFDPQNTLCFDFVRGPATGSGNSYPGAGGYVRGGSNGAANPFMANRVWGTPGTATGSTDAASTQAVGYANACEVTWIPASGLYAGFTATPVEGQSPLQVQFTDKSYSSDPAGVQSWAWDFNNDQIIDSTAQNPQFTFTGVGYDNKFTVSLEVTDNSHPNNKVTKKDYIIVNPFPVASATAFGKGSTVPAGVPGPIQMPAYSRTYSISSQVRGWWAQAPVTFVINGFDVPNEQNATDQSVWFFTTPNTTQPSSYTPTAADTKFLGTGPVGTTLTPTAPIVVQQGTWFGVMGACHDAAGTTMHNSYDAGTAALQTTTVTGSPMKVSRLTANMNFVTNATVGTIAMSFATSGQIARVDVHVPGNLQSTIPLLAASGDTPYFGGNPTLDMTASIPSAQAGLLAASLVQLPTTIPTPFGGLLISPSFLLTFVVPNGTGSVQLPIPNDPNFADAHIYWQGIVFDLTNNVYGMTNGMDWRIGQQ
jgi:PKD repeat protein